MEFCTQCGKKQEDCICNSEQISSEEEFGENVFCTQCGKPMKAGQIHNCSMSTPTKFNLTRMQSILPSMKNRMGIGDPEINERDTYERKMQIVPDSIKANDGEIPVKQYKIAILRNLLKFERAEGRIQITNKRIIFRAAGRSIVGRTTLQQEFAMDEIAGIEVQKNYKFSPLHLIGGLSLIILTAFIGFLLPIWFSSDDGSSGFGQFLGLLFWVGGMIPFFAISKKFMIKLLGLGISLGAILAIATISAMLRTKDIMYSSRYSSSYPLASLMNDPINLLVILTGLITLFGLFLHFMRPNLVISIKNKSAQASVDIRRNNILSRNMALLLLGPIGIIVILLTKPSDFDIDSGFAEVMPTPETESAIREMGTMIMDIQKLGDSALEKWSKK